MSIARRLYLYLVAFISFQMVLASVRNLLRLVLSQLLDTAARVTSTEQYARDQLSLWGAVLLVGTAVWIIHWYLAQRLVAGATPEAREERQSVLRKLFLYGTLIVVLWQVSFGLASTLEASLLTPGAMRQRLLIVDQVPSLLIGGVAWAYYWRVTRADAAVVPEQGAAAVVARWYSYLVTVGALSLLLWGLSMLARELWQQLVAGQDGETIALERGNPPIAYALGRVVAGGIVWLTHWSLAQRRLIASAEERHSALRKVALYLIVLETTAVALTNLSLFCYRFLRELIGTGGLASSSEPRLALAGGPLLTALVYGIFWWYHRRVIRGDARLVVTEPVRSATIRRIYDHLVALVGLVVLAIGVTNLLRLLTDLLLGGRQTALLGVRGWGDQISFCATLIAVGAPVWLTHWLPLLRRSLGVAGTEERQSLVRRIYLFGLLFASVIALLVSVALLIYRVLRSLGVGLTADDIGGLSWAIGASITAGVVLAYHLRLLLADQRQRPAVEPVPALPTQQQPPTLLLHLSGSDLATVNAALDRLREELPAGLDLTIFSADGVTHNAVRQWLAGRRAVTESGGADPDVSNGDR